MFECLLRQKKYLSDFWDTLWTFAIFISLLVVNYKAQSKPMFVIRINLSQVKRLKANIKFVFFFAYSILFSFEIKFMDKIISVLLEIGKGWSDRWQWPLV